jgi:hypothetical protein
MTPQMHAELEALCPLFYSGEISDEEWALLQIHMAYCDGCHQTFLQYHQASASEPRFLSESRILSGSRH